MSPFDAFASLTFSLAVLPSWAFASLFTTPATLTTSLGKVTGVRKVVVNSKVDVFYGIPFAQPPVGELRFRPPIPATPWKGVRDATQKPNSCWQAIDTSFGRFPGAEMWNPNTPRSEDCLYLNIWRPASAEFTDKPKRIMFWIFGGGFWSGTTTLPMYDGSFLAAHNDVIVVSIAYRIGALGFLYLGNYEAPGNAGLLDQVMALEWVKSNSVNIGGSPDNITIFGESAGASSVGFHLLSPLSKDLFKYAIMESSSPLAYWAIQDTSKAKDRASKLAKSVSCSSGTSDEILRCLRRADPKDLVYKQWQVVNSWFDVPFGPVVDRHFLPDHPMFMLKRGEMKKTNVTMGVNKNEGIFWLMYSFKKYFPLDGDGQVTQQQFNTILRGILKDSDKSVDEVKEEYFRDTNQTLTDIIDAISGDTLFKCPVVDFAREFTRHGGQVYMYSFEHRVSTNPWPEWLGVAHGYETEIVFGLPWGSKARYTEEEKTLSVEVMDMWTNFSATGNPNYGMSGNLWPHYTLEKEKYAIIDGSGVRQGQHLRSQECSFWAK